MISYKILRHQHYYRLNSMVFSFREICNRLPSTHMGWEDAYLNVISCNVDTIHSRLIQVMYAEKL